MNFREGNHERLSNVDDGDLASSVVWCSCHSPSCQVSFALTVSKRPGTSYQIEIHFAVVNRLYLLFSFVKLVET